jgi:hypothetical protein
MKFLAWLIGIFSGKPPRPGLRFFLNAGANTYEITGMPKHIIHFGASLKITAKAVDALGHEAGFEGPAWVSSNPGVLEITPAGDLEAVVKAVGLGEASIEFRADGAVGERVHIVFGRVDFEAVAPDAVAVELAVGEEFTAETPVPAAESGGEAGEADEADEADEAAA